MPRRRCLGGCGRYITEGSRCGRCSVKTEYGRKEYKENRKAIIEAHIANFGYVCPGFERDAHEAHPTKNPLTIDHIKPLARGGTAEVVNLQVLCRICNGLKSDR